MIEPDKFQLSRYSSSLIPGKASMCLWIKHWIKKHFGVAYASWIWCSIDWLSRALSTSVLDASCSTSCGFSYFLHLGQWMLRNLPQSSQGARKEKPLRTPTEKKWGWFSVHVYVSLCEKQNTNTQTHKGWTGIACPLHLPVTLTVPLVLFSTCQVEESVNAAMALDITLWMPQDVNW